MYQYTTSCTLTPAPPPTGPIAVNSNEVSAVVGQNTLRVCVQLTTFTDLFANYRFSVNAHHTLLPLLTPHTTHTPHTQVNYGTTTSLTSDVVNITVSNCVTVTGLTPASTVYYRYVSTCMYTGRMLLQSVVEPFWEPVVIAFIIFTCSFFVCIELMLRTAKAVHPQPLSLSNC